MSKTLSERLTEYADVCWMCDTCMSKYLTKAANDAKAMEQVIQGVKDVLESNEPLEAACKASLISEGTVREKLNVEPYEHDEAEAVANAYGAFPSLIAKLRTLLTEAKLIS